MIKQLRRSSRRVATQSGRNKRNKLSWSFFCIHLQPASFDSQITLFVPRNLSIDGTKKTLLGSIDFMIIVLGSMAFPLLPYLICIPYFDHNLYNTKVSNRKLDIPINFLSH